ncbi:MAG TPA: xanthine dehydrogenase family protein molybdopterin-binding subunit [Burkholderiales bacterium]|nr:xanthine dehydrogenase family protein molybdopterin-binding subunit [Burkholderiales bacterium]
MESAFKYVGRKRRVKEDRRFVLGRGRFVADVQLPGVKHLAVITSPYPCARIKAIRTDKARAAPGVHYVLTGAELAQASNPLMVGVDAPNVKRYPFAVDIARYAGEWVAAVVADTRHLAEDACELIEVDYEPQPFLLDPEQALAPDAVLVHAEHGSNVLYRRKFVWGDVDGDFARAPHRLELRVRWNRSSTVPIETFGVAAQWDAGRELLDVWASIQMPKYPEQIARALRLPANCVRVHYDVDVGGSYGMKRGIKHTVTCAYLSRKLGFPVRFIEDRLENMRGGDAHGPDRLFDVALAFDADGTVRSMRMRALDDVGAYTGRAPLQLGKPVTAIVGPYRIGSVEYEPISVLTNKTPQEAVRGFGQSPTNAAIEAGIDAVARQLGIDRIEVRRRNLIRKDEFPYTIPSGSRYDSGDYHAVLDKLLAAADYPSLLARRDALRAQGRLAGIGISTCLEPSGGNAAFEPLFNPKNDTTVWMESSLVRVDLLGCVTVVLATPSAGQGHESLAATVVGEELQLDPDTIRVVRADSLSALPTNTPVASRMAIMIGGAATAAARAIRERMLAIASHNLKLSLERLEYRDGTVYDRNDPSRALTFVQLADIAHRRYHQLPPGMEPGMQAQFTYQVPTGGKMPDADGRVQMYPCYSLEAHLLLIEIDPDTAQPKILSYHCGHDCGVMFNPDIVHGMTYGGIAHGIGAALYEKFHYDDGGQLAAQSFMDYLLPTAHEVPDIHLVDHCTPSPLTSHGQKGSGEAGYMGAPAAIASAVNDALAPLGRSIHALPMRLRDIDAVLQGGKT